MVWEVQVVMKASSMRSRPRTTIGRQAEVRRDSKERLYALRRRFVVVVDAKGMAIKVLGNFAPWWSMPSPQRVITKKRLVKIVDSANRAVIIRFANEGHALDFAATIRDECGIEPTTHTADADTDESTDQRELEKMAALFMTSTEFRERVRQLHGCLQEFWDV